MSTESSKFYIRTNVERLLPMSLARFAIAAFFAANFLNTMTAPLSFAQENTNNSSHRGGVQEDVFRIRRGGAPKTTVTPKSDQPKLYGTIQKSKVLPPTQPLVPMDPAADLVRANDYATPVAPFKAAQPIPASAMMNQAPPKPESKFVWGQSAAGGYFDASGQMKENVMGDQLYKFGGKFMDGTPVPTTPVVCNFKGHVYKPYVVKR